MARGGTARKTASKFSFLRSVVSMSTVPERPTTAVPVRTSTPAPSSARRQAVMKPSGEFGGWAFQ